MVDVVWRPHRHWDARTESLGSEAHSSELQALWDRLLDTFAAPGVVAVIDAYSDHDRPGTLPPEAREAMETIRALGAERPKVRDGGMGVPLRLDDEQHRHLAATFGPWSINVDVSDEHGNIFGVHDCRHLWVTLTPDELSAFRRDCERAGVYVDARLEPFEYKSPPPVVPVLLIVAVVLLAAVVWGLLSLIG